LTVVEEEFGDTDRAIAGWFTGYRRAAVPVLAVTAIAVIVLLANWAIVPTGSQPIGSVAVLRFANISGDETLDYFSDGLGEGLIDSLSQLPALNVIASTSSFQYRGQEIDPRQVGRALGVEAIVAGRVLRRGGGLEVRVELVAAAARAQLWGKTYERNNTELHAVQEDIARSIAGKLRPPLTAEQRRRLTKRATGNEQAYRLYLIGLFQARKHTGDGLKKALDYYSQAVAIDPNFALAFAAMTPVYSNLANTGQLDPREAVARGKAAALKALEIDPELAQAHSSIAHTKRNEWDWPEAEREFQRAIELNPNLAGVHSGYSILLTILGRTGEALAANGRAQELDPLRISFKANEGGILAAARRFDEALPVLHDAIKMEPGYAFSHLSLGHVYLGKGMYAESINEDQAASRIFGAAVNSLIDFGYVYAKSGKRKEAIAILNQLRSGKQYVSPAGLAILYAGLSDREAALGSLELAFVQRDPQIQNIHAEPRFDSLRAEPRFQALFAPPFPRPVEVYSRRRPVSVEHPARRNRLLTVVWRGR